MTDLSRQLVASGHALAAEGLVTAFGHVSAREPPGETVLITPARPLGSLDVDEQLPRLSLGAEELSPSVPGETWIHLTIYEARPEVNAVCRAQPPVAAAFAVTGTPIRALHGQGAMLGADVPVYDGARLVRSRELGLEVAASLGRAHALLLRGNGAVTVGSTVGEAVARMWVLESSARLNRDAATLGAEARELDGEEVAGWLAVAPEILDRIWKGMTQ